MSGPAESQHAMFPIHPGWTGALIGKVQSMGWDFEKTVVTMKK